MCGSQWRDWFELILFRQIISSVVNASDKTKMSVSRKPCISRRNYGNFDRTLPISGNDYFVSVNILCPL